MAIKSFTQRKRIRKSFGRIHEVAPMPNLIEVQKASYDQFLQINIPVKDRTSSGLQAVFESVFPIRDFSENGTLEFVSYELEEPKYDVDECQLRGMTYAAPLKLTLRLVVFDTDEDTGARSIRDIKEQDVYMGDMPLMTDNGTFVVNGTERVIVSQMHRSPGVFFDHDRGKTHSSGKLLFAARVIPYRGSWLDFEFDAKDLVYVRIDRRRKLPVSTLLMALDSKETAEERERLLETGEVISAEQAVGMTAEEIFDYFYGKVTFTRIKEGWKVPFDEDAYRGTRLSKDLVDARSGKVLAEEGTRMTPRVIRELSEKGFKDQLLGLDDLVGRYLAEDIVNSKTGEIFAEAGDELTLEYDKEGEIEGGTLKVLLDAQISEIPTLAIGENASGPYIRNTLIADKNFSRVEALMDIYRVMRPGEPPTPDTAEAMFNSLFFDAERYDLSSVGRVKMNARLSQETE
ncbi:MAG: DNA-directed RNA polymerase subunit beta, partial [Alphaproteobacteria bacterium]